MNDRSAARATAGVFRRDALRPAVEWLNNPRSRIDPTVSGDRILDTDETIAIAEKFLKWIQR